MFTYHAPKPHLEESRHPGVLFSAFNSKLRKMILPSLTYPSQVVPAEQLSQVEESHEVRISQGWVKTYDGAELATLQFEPSRFKQKSSNERRYVVRFFGNKGALEYGDKIEICARDAKKLDATVICFNYRGVVSSKKPPVIFHDVVIDGIAQVQRLLDLGIDSKNIKLDGISFGGAVATKTAAYFHRRSLPVYLWNDRSFSSLYLTALYMYFPSSPGWLNELSAKMLTPVFKGILSSAGWGGDVVPDYMEIPNDYKAHMVVAKKSKHSAGDRVIWHPASLYKSVRPHEKKLGYHTSYKVVTRSAESHCGHGKMRHRLFHKKNREQTGQDLYEAFVRGVRL